MSQRLAKYPAIWGVISNLSSNLPEKSSSLQVSPTFNQKISSSLSFNAQKVQSLLEQVDTLIQKLNQETHKHPKNFHIESLLKDLNSMHTLLALNQDSSISDAFVNIAQSKQKSLMSSASELLQTLNHIQDPISKFTLEQANEMMDSKISKVIISTLGFGLQINQGAFLQSMSHQDFNYLPKFKKALSTVFLRSKELKHQIETGRNLELKVKIMKDQKTKMRQEAKILLQETLKQKQDMFNCLLQEKNIQISLLNEVKQQLENQKMRLKEKVVEIQSIVQEKEKFNNILSGKIKIKEKQSKNQAKKNSEAFQNQIAHLEFQINQLEAKNQQLLIEIQQKSNKYRKKIFQKQSSINTSQQIKVSQLRQKLNQAQKTIEQLKIKAEQVKVVHKESIQNYQNMYLALQKETSQSYNQIKEELISSINQNKQLKTSYQLKKYRQGENRGSEYYQKVIYDVRYQITLLSQQIEQQISSQYQGPLLKKILSSLHMIILEMLPEYKTESFDFTPIKRKSCQTHQISWVSQTENVQESLKLPGAQSILVKKQGRWSVVPSPLKSSNH